MSDKNIEKTVLTGEQIKENLELLMQDWVVEGGKLKLSIELDDFITAVDSVNEIAEVAEEYNHHPSLHIHDYNVLDIELITHSVSKLTKIDFEVAKTIDLMF